MKKIAVLLSVYKNDSPLYLKKSVNSLLEQTLKPDYILIGVDGKVSEELDALLKDLSCQQGVEVCEFDKNRGLACVLNDLIIKANSLGCEYYARMDADDISLINRFEKQVSFLESHPDVDVIGGAIEEIDSNDNLRGKRVTYPYTHDDCLRFFRYRDPVAHPSVMFRSRFFEKVSGGYRNEYRKNQDTMLWYDGFMNGCVFANLPDVVLHFRVNDAFFFRRNGWKRAKKMFGDRLKINKNLNYDITANLFAIGMFCMTVSPSWIKKILYRLR